MQFEVVRQGVYKISEEVNVIQGGTIPKDASEVIIPKSVNKIEDCAFFGYEKLKTVNIPNLVTSIGNNVFYGCKLLTDMPMNDNITKIGDNAFARCDGFKNITIPKNVTEIGSYAFSACRNLERVNIVGEITTVPRNAFLEATSLKTVNLPNTVKKIEGNAFKRCEKLEEITIPWNVKIKEEAFDECHSIRKIKVMKKNGDIRVININENESIKVALKKNKIKVIKREPTIVVFGNNERVPFRNLEEFQIEVFLQGEENRNRNAEIIKECVSKYPILHKLQKTNCRS